MSDQVALRFAPSPTGPLHIGGVRTALFNYLFAKKHGGRFILRIEDTDRNRYVPGAEEHIIESFKWLGIEFNEGVNIGGEFGPYRQSERKEQGIYKKFVDQLVEDGFAYLAFDTPEELDIMREKLKEAGNSNLQYNFMTRGSMSNSLTLSQKEVKARIAAGEPYVVRMKMPRKEEIRFHDIVREWVVFHSSQLDDKILLKSDGWPTYHLANVVDDYHMGITHVIRGEEWLSSTPLHVMLYRALGWEDKMPTFVHLPLIMNPNGVGKMSKRQGDKLGFSVFPTSWTDPESGKISKGYREDGYLAEAMMNFLALLGWSTGDDEELMDEPRLVELFTLDNLNNSGAKFDLEKLNWFNETYIRKKPASELTPWVKEDLERKGIQVPENGFIEKMIHLLQERVTQLGDFADQGTYLIQAPETYLEKARKKYNETSEELLLDFYNRISSIVVWEASQVEKAFEELIEEKNVGKGKVLAPLRLVLTGTNSGPGLFDIAELIGKDSTLERIKVGIERLK